MTSFEEEVKSIYSKLRAFDAVENAKAKIPNNWQDNEIHIIERIPIKNDTDFLTVKITFIRIGNNDWLYKKSTKM